MVLEEVKEKDLTRAEGGRVPGSGETNDVIGSARRPQGRAGN